MEQQVATNVRHIIISLIDSHKILEMDYRIHRRKNSEKVIIYKETDNVERDSDFYIFEIEIIEIRDKEGNKISLRECASFASIKETETKEKYIIYDNKPLYDIGTANWFVSTFTLSLCVHLLTGNIVIDDGGLLEIRSKLISKYKFEIHKKN